ncbi:hypothetical protein EC973_003485 [Apophysomyces ossiformis]|uniref:Uncharacterized protein n=1 Tax=Apophysomyces ossiformis TaxID=679940 RepID=A0A8H7BH77_9FUNG|nr:hypothetical protein EC973_003485 [Apophysomyces ossiformis]
MKFALLVTVAAIFSVVTQAAPWGPAWQKAHRHQEQTTDVTQTQKQTPSVPDVQKPRPNLPQVQKPRPDAPHIQKQTSSVTHIVQNVGNEGSSSGIANGLLAGGIINNNEKKISITQNA